MARQKRSATSLKWGHDVHKYIKVTFNREGTSILWKCILTNCGHYLVNEMVLGRQCVCHRCENIFEMGRKNLDQKKPHCITCTRPANTKGRKTEGDNEINTILQNLDDLLRVD